MTSEHSHAHPAGAEHDAYDASVALWLRRVTAGETPSASLADAEALASLPAAAVADTAHRHRVAPWVRAALTEHQARIPAEHWARLSAAAEQHVNRTLAHYVGLLRLLEWAESETIEVVVLKGATVARWYPDPLLRPYSDVDLLLQEVDVDRVVARLVESGFAEKPHSHDDPAHHEHGEFQRIFMHGVTGQIVEVHVNHLQIGLRPVGMRDIWERSQPITLHRTTARSLEANDLFVHLAVHLHRHGFDRLIWFKDLDLIARTGTLDWDRVADLADEQGCGESLAATLELLVEMLGTPLPPEAISIIRTRSRVSRWLFNRVWKPSDVAALLPRRRWRMRRAVQFAPETGLLRGGLLAFLFTGRRRDKLRILVARLRHRQA